MLGADPLSAGEVGNRPRHLHQPVAAPSAEMEPLARRVENPEPGRVEGAVAGEGAALQARVHRRTRRFTGAPAGDRLRSCWVSRAAATRRRTSDEPSPGAVSVIALKGTAGTRTLRSIRSSSGPDRRLR